MTIFQPRFKIDLGANLFWTFSIVVVVLLAVSSRTIAADLPIGIPAPPFGLNESHQIYSNDSSYQVGSSGPYSHYVDNSRSCSDSENGTAANPRCSIPTSLTAGDVVEVHGGPYAFRAHLKIHASGTSNRPIFIRGVDDGNGVPVLDGQDDNGKLYLDGSYTILENLSIETSGLRLGTEIASDHIASRNVNVGFHEKNCINVGGSFMVISDSEVHHCQDNTLDRHGIQILAGSNFVWILHNDIHHNSGNGIQYTHGAELDPPDNVFIGGNLIHSDREVGIASKWAAKSVISSNVIHSIKPSTAGEEWCFDDGSSCMIPDSAVNGPGIQFGADGYPQEKWVIFNLIYDTNHCIRNEESIKARIIGNICANIPGGGVVLEKRGEDMYIVNNTFYKTGLGGQSGVIQQYWRDNFAPQVHNNIFYSPVGRALWFETRSVVEQMVLNNNLFWGETGPLEILWRNTDTTFGSISELRNVVEADLAGMAGNQYADPRLNVPTSTQLFRQDFALDSGSPAIGAGDSILELLDAEFKASFGAGLTIIPGEWAGGTFDIGAVPAGDAEPPVRPMPPVID